LTFLGGGLLDDIQFSPSLIPEPSDASLIFLGGGIFMYFRARNQKFGLNSRIGHERS